MKEGGEKGEACRFSTSYAEGLDHPQLSLYARPSHLRRGKEKVVEDLEEKSSEKDHKGKGKAKERGKKGLFRKVKDEESPWASSAQGSKKE